MAVSIIRCSQSRALEVRQRLAADRPELDDQILVSDLWVVLAPDGVVALIGVARLEEMRLLWFVTSPVLRLWLCSFVRVSSRFVRGLAAADALPLLVPVTAESGARLAKLLGMHRLVACRSSGIEYWEMS